MHPVDSEDPSLFDGAMLQQRVQSLLNEGLQQGHRLALSSDLWRYASECSSACDVLLTLSHQDDDESMKETVHWIVNTLRHLEPALVVEVRYHRLNDCYGLYLTAEYRDLLKGAELCHLKKPLKLRFGGGMRDFCFDEAHCFVGVEHKAHFLSGTERALIVKQILESVRIPRGGMVLSTRSRKVELPGSAPLVGQLSAAGLVDRSLPLHNKEELRNLQKGWVMSLVDRQPLDAIKNYFGTEIAMYFSWLGFLTTALWFPAGIGLAMFFFGGGVYRIQQGEPEENDEEDTYQLFSDICFVLFAFFNCIWSTVYLELWKRKQAELAFKWGTYTVEANALLQDPRPGFKGEYTAPNAVTGLPEPQYPAWKSAAVRYGLTYPVTGLCVLVMFAAMLGIFMAQDTANFYFGHSSFFGWVCYLPMVVYALLVVASEKLYRLLALFLNDLENYRTAEEYENFLVSKIVIFQFVTAFGSLFYTAFIIRDMRRLQETLATLLITRQLTQNIMEMAVPFVIEKFKFSQLTYKMTRSMSDDTLRRHVQQVRRKRKESDDAPSNSSPLTPNDLHETFEVRRRKMAREQSPSEEDELDVDSSSSYSQLNGTSPKIGRSPRLPLPEFVPYADGVEVTQAELESLMSVYERPLDDYLEMFIQFGYVLLFSPAFPLAAACALLNNLIEIRVDAFKLCNTVQRPFGRRVKDIGAWQHSMQWLGTLGVMVNCALIGQSGLVQRIWPGISWASQIVLIVILEHVILGIRALVDSAVPDVPEWIRVEIAKQEHYRKEAFKRSTRLIDRLERPELAQTPPIDPVVIPRLEGLVETADKCPSPTHRPSEASASHVEPRPIAAGPSADAPPAKRKGTSSLFKRRSITPMMRFTHFMRREPSPYKN